MGTARVVCLGTGYKILWFVPKDFQALSVDEVAPHTPVWSALKGLQGPQRREKCHQGKTRVEQRYCNSGTNNLMIGQKAREILKSESKMVSCETSEGEFQP